MSNKSKTRILLIYTGGTIGMLENPATGVLEPLDFAYLKQQVPELSALSCSIDVLTLDPPIDSSAITPSSWIDIAQLIQQHYHSHDGFVVLHGTDTMAYSASALSFILRGLAKPVIFTGSQLPIGRLRTDGKENLISAIEIAASRRDDGSPRVPEVCIFFQNVLLRGNRASKVSADQFQAFKSHNYPRLAYAGIEIRYNDNFIHRSPGAGGIELHTNLDTRVALLKLFPGMGREQVCAILEMPGLRGVVMETFGSGNAPMADWFIHALEEALARDIVIVNITQCSTGHVDMKRYETGLRLHKMGIVSGMDMTTEAAITKLMVLCGQSLSTSDIKRLMGQPRRGEMSLEQDSDDLLCWEMLNNKE